MDIVERLRAMTFEEFDEWPVASEKLCKEAAAMIASQARRIEELEKALEPFAGYLDTAAYDLDNKGNPLPDDHGMGWVYLNVGHFRRARALLRAKGGEHGE